MTTPVLPLWQKHSPISLLPFELLSYIFLCCQTHILSEFLPGQFDDDPTTVESVSATKIVISHVCTWWREVALGTPALWVRICVSGLKQLEAPAHVLRETSLTSKLDYIRTYLARSQQAPLDVRIDFSDPCRPVAPSARLALVQPILEHAHRWKRCTISLDVEYKDWPIMRSLAQLPVPELEFLSLAVTELDGDVPKGHSGVSLLAPQTLVTETGEGPKKLSFLRLRGLALIFFRPPFTSLTTLHLDQTKGVHFRFPQFRELLLLPKCLINLSIYGDIIRQEELWPHPTEDSQIQLPELRRLRVGSLRGNIYSGILLCIHAPRLESLFFRSLAAQDLDRFCTSPFTSPSKFENVRYLTFVDFDIGPRGFKSLIRVFPTIEEFTTIHPVTDNPSVLKLIAGPESEPSTCSRPWPSLKTLTLNVSSSPGRREFSASNVVEAITERVRRGYSLEKLRLVVSPPERYQYSDAGSGWSDDDEEDLEECEVPEEFAVLGGNGELGGHKIDIEAVRVEDLALWLEGVEDVGFDDFLYL